MNSNIQTFIDSLPIYDVHEHHMPGSIDRSDVGLHDIFRESYAGWTRGLPFPLRSDIPFIEPSKEDDDWENISQYIDESGSNSFVRNIIRALTELYHLEEGTITSQNWQSLDEKIRRRHRDKRWPGEVLDRAGINRIITDPFENPLINVRDALGERYLSVLRVNALAFGDGVPLVKAFTQR